MAGCSRWALENFLVLHFISAAPGHILLLPCTGECPVADYKKRYRWGDSKAAACGQIQSALLEQNWYWRLSESLREKSKYWWRSVAYNWHVQDATLAQDNDQNVDCIVSAKLKKNHRTIIFTGFVFLSMITLVCFNTMSRNVEGLGISPFITFSMFALTLPPAGTLQAGIQKFIGRKASSVGAMLFSGLFTAGSGIVLSIWQEPSTVFLVSLNVIARFGISVCFGSVLLFSSELVPTCVRSRGLGLAHIAGAALSLLSPYILHMGTYYRAAPSIVLCLMFFIGSYVSLLLPETSDRKLPITLAEGEQFGKDDRIFDFLKSSKVKDAMSLEETVKNT